MLYKFINKDLAVLLWLAPVVSGLIFTSGTVLFILCLNTTETTMLPTVKGFAAIAFLTESALIAALLGASYRYKTYRKRLLVRAALLAANIPVGIVYCIIYLKLTFPYKP